MFRKILIANRGEIACRVMETAQNMGIKTVAVYSDADKEALHTLTADEAIYIGKSPANESYLCVDKIIQAAIGTGAEAIHPGYGFLSENAELVATCKKHNITFIGPSTHAMEVMGSKSESKKLMEKAGVPTVPGYHGKAQDAATLQKEADKIGYPLLIKAVAGGGGKGMKLVEKSTDFKQALDSAKREGKASFGNDEVLLEKYLVKPRHIEFQIFGDTHGNTIHLCERDCSLQRRHQKVLEEAPAPGMTDALRKKMGEAAVNAAKAVDYTGAGTVEFLLDKDENFYFMEMNTRLQVEHPITEMITGIDLVEWQLRIADGEKLPITQKEVTIEGHAFEARIYAEDPANNFLPATGIIQLFTTDEEARLDTGVVTGDEISPYYDPMIAKLIVWGETRSVALANMATALENTHILGPTSNVPYLHAITQNEDFASENIDTSLLEKHHASLTASDNIQAPLVAALVKILTTGEETSPWDSLPAWRLGGKAEEKITFMMGGEKQTVTFSYTEDGYRMEGKTVTAELLNDQLFYTINLKPYQAVIAWDEAEEEFWISVGGYNHSITPFESEVETEKEAFTGNLTAPTSGTVIKVNTKAGEKVSAGHDLVILEAMKTEYRISAPRDGIVQEVCTKEGEHVAKDSLLVHMLAEAEEARV